MARPRIGQTVDGFLYKGGDPSDKNSWEASPSAAPSEGLQVGQEVDGYVFKGGNPNDQNNWESTTPEITQEMLPEFTTGDRLTVKNFSNNTDDAIAYLQKQHPELEIKQNNGEIIARKPGDKAYKTLDPNTGFFSSDFLSDVGDVAYDVVSGVPVQAATALGGALGFASPIPGGTLAGASLAGSAANAGNEYLRQGIGQMLGVNKNIDTGALKTAGIVGAASPLLMGVDKVPGANLLAKIPGVSKLAGATAKEGFEEAGRGLLNRGGVGALSLANGQSKENIREGFKRLDAIKQFEEAGVTDFVDDAHDGIKTAIDSAKNETGAEIGNIIESTGARIDLNDVKDKFKTVIDKYQESADKMGSDAFKEKVTNMKGTYDRLFGADVIPDTNAAYLNRPVKETTVNAKLALQLQQELAEVAEFNKTNNGLLSRLFGKSTSDKELGNAAGDAYKVLGSKLSKAVEDAGEATGNLAELRKKYSDYIRLQKDLAPKFSSPEKTYNTLRTLGGKNKQYFYEKLKGMDERLGTNVVDKAKELEVFSLYSKAPADAISSGGVTSTSRTAPLAIAMGTLGYGLGGFPGGAIGTFLGAKMASPAATRMGFEIAKPLVNFSDRFVPAAAKNSAWNAMMNQKGN